MLYILKIGDLNHDEVKDFIFTNFGNTLSLWKKMYSSLSEKESLRKIVESLLIMIKPPDKVKRHADMMQSSSSDNCICQYNVNKHNRNLKSIIENQR